MSIPNQTNTAAPETDPLTPLVARVLHIEDTTWGSSKQGYLVRYRGRLYSQDSAAAYDQLAASLRPLNITPLFRMDEQRHAILLISGTIQAHPSKTWVNATLFVLTLLSVLFAGALYTYQGPITEDPLAQIMAILANLDQGISFAISLLAILLAHEFGHYLAGRYHHTVVTLPYFIPFPLSAFGTMGAFIQMKEPPRNRRILLDIGIAGPLAGLAVAIPVVLLGLYLSPVQQIPMVLPEGQVFEGNSILYLFLKMLVKGEMLPRPAEYGNLGPILYWLRYFFTGLPLPRGGWDVTLHPIAWAGWAGLLVTALNLIPAGQLDGGHLISVLLGKRAIKLLPFILGGLALLGIFWSGWWLWAVLIFVLGRLQAEPLDTITPLDTKRRALALFGLVIFVLVFTPVPLM
ncbi:MAG: site-2 protease family protein [Anaerolineales bacterium]|nr:site-2 protease family protein [Anaerolineales bacterium]